MRVGQNPAKTMQDVVQPAAVTAAIITYIPTLGGYYAESLDVLKLCLTSMREHADMEVGIMVFDNASCAEVREYLLEEQSLGHIQYLVLSEKNVGKAGAWNYIFGAAPGEFIAYADSDVYFFPGWLKPQVDTLQHFINAGMVTGLPMLTPPEFSTETIKWAQENEDILFEKGRFLSWEDFWRHARSLGGDEPKARAFYEAHEDLTFEAHGRRYYIGAAHFQFVARKAALLAVSPLPSNRPMGQVRILDEKINAQGYLRLCMDQWYAQHMGNTLPDEKELHRAGRQAPLARSKPRIWQRGPLRRILQTIYDWSFELLYRA